MLIIIIVYLPILTLEGVEGKMFRPMALTVVFALIGSLILALTLMPVLAALAFRKHTEEREPRLVHWLKARYRPILGWTLGHPGLTGGVAAGVFVLSLGLVPFMGSEFIPRLDEGAIAVQAWRLPSVALTESVKSTTMIEKTLKKFPEVVTVVSRTGVAEIPTDPMGLETSDIYVILKDHSEWTTASDREGLIEKFNEALEAEVPGNVFSYSQPIELRVQELIAGVRSDVAITVFGEDLDQLRQVGDRDRRRRRRHRRRGRCEAGANGRPAVPAGAHPPRRNRALWHQRVPGARRGAHDGWASRRRGPRGSAPLLDAGAFHRRASLERRGDRQHQDRGFARADDSAVAAGRHHPRGWAGPDQPREYPPQDQRRGQRSRPGPGQLHRRRPASGSGAGYSFPTATTSSTAASSRTCSGPRVDWPLVVPLALFLIFVLLYTTFNAVKPAVLIYFNIPVAATGGIVALFLRGHAVQHLRWRRLHRAVRRGRAQRRRDDVLLSRTARTADSVSTTPFDRARS